MWFYSFVDVSGRTCTPSAGHRAVAIGTVQPCYSFFVVVVRKSQKFKTLFFFWYQINWTSGSSTTDSLEAYNGTEDFYHKHPLKLMHICHDSCFLVVLLLQPLAWRHLARVSCARVAMQSPYIQFQRERGSESNQTWEYLLVFLLCKRMGCKLSPFVI